ncbi:MAG: putative Ig domain-containing protein [Micropruina sp.]|nr:putative Ig domain-containing protein [Micropruina sp.]
MVNKYDRSGALLWSDFRVSTTPWWANHATGVALDADGNIYVAGGYPYFRADSDYIVTKYDRDGNEQWTTSYSEGIALPLAITVDPFGDVVVTGMSRKIDQEDVLTVKFDPAGNRVWATSVPGKVFAQGADIDTDADGNVYVGGRHTYVFSENDGFREFGHSYLTLKYAPNGDVLWSHFSEDLETVRLSAGRAIVVDPSGNSYVGGGLAGAIERRDPSGELVWRESLFFEDREVDISAMAFDGYGNLVVGGQYFDPVVEQWLKVLATVDTDGQVLWSRRIGGDNLRTALGLSVDSSNVIHVAVARDGHLVVTTFRTSLGFAATELPDGVRGDLYRQPLRTTGGATPLTWSVSAGSLPPGLDLDPDSGVLAGIPTDGGTFTFSATVTGSDGEAVTRQLTLSIAVVAIDPVTVTPAATGVPWQLQLSGHGGTPPLTWRIASGELPPGLTLGSASGLIAGTPTVGGTYKVTVEVADAEGHQASVTVTILVVEPLRILTTELPDAVAGSPYSVQLDASGGTLPYRWFYWGNPVPGLDVDTDRGIISGTPTSPGVYDSGVYVMDSTGTWVTQRLTIVVG